MHETNAYVKKCLFSYFRAQIINTTQEISRMRRATPRRIFFFLASLFSGLILLGNINQTFKSFTVNVINQDKLADDVTENKTVLKLSNESADVKK